MKGSEFKVSLRWGRRQTVGLKASNRTGKLETPKPVLFQFSVGSTLLFGAGRAFAGLPGAAGGAGGAGGTGAAVAEARRVSIPSCSLLTTICDEPLPTLPLARDSCSSLFTFNSGKS